MVGSQWFTSLGFVSGVGLIIWEIFRLVFLTDKGSFGWWFLMFQEETKSQEYFRILGGQFFFQYCWDLLHLHCALTEDAIGDYRDLHTIYFIT